MAVPAIYTDPLGEPYPSDAQAAAGLTLTVRWHNKLARAGNAEGGYSAEIIEGVDRLVFLQPQLDALGLVLERTGVVTIPGYGTAWELDSEAPTDGPLTVYWNVAGSE